MLDTLDQNASAVRDGLEALRLNSVHLNPHSALFSDDGILTFVWERGETGFALLFAGDGVVTVARKSPGQHYAEGGTDCPISGPLPADFYAFLHSL